jgi:hypothetical protein
MVKMKNETRHILSCLAGLLAVGLYGINEILKIYYDNFSFNIIVAFLTSFIFIDYSLIKLDYIYKK